MGNEKKPARVVALKGYDISVPNQMVSMADVLKKHIVKQQLSTNIMGNDYAHVEGWQFAGGLMGIFPRVTKVENLSQGTEKKWMAEVEIVRLKDNVIIGFGAAICSSLEGKKKSFDEYAILSMAQTRAIGKAYRNSIGWVMKLAGYEGTPKEEMTNVNDEVVTQKTQTARDLVDYKKKLYNEILRRTKKDKLSLEEVCDFINKKTGLIVSSINSQKHAQTLLALLLQNK